MNIQVAVDGTLPSGVYIGWTPRQVKVTLSNLPAGAGPIPLQVSNSGAGKLLFTKDRAVRGTKTLALEAPRNSPTATFFVAGEFVFPNKVVNEAQMTVAAVGTADKADQPITIRVRKNANRLTDKERDLFLSALADVNARGLGPFQAIRNMHLEDLALNQAHASEILSGEHFLPWHRAYLLDLERHLQTFQPSVALHYWKFDERAPNVFKPAFMGSSSNAGVVTFTAGHPLTAWETDGGWGITRAARFTEGTSSPFQLNRVFRERRVLDMTNQYRPFIDIEFVSHGGAHTSFGFDLSSADTAPKDPMFFLLHCNVDRLWARWQDQWNRFAKGSPLTYNLQGQSPSKTDVGRAAKDTMWPWDGVKGGQRPNSFPRKDLPSSPTHSAPGKTPSIASMIDYQGRHDPADEMGFDYEDVPFWR